MTISTADAGADSAAGMGAEPAVDTGAKSVVDMADQPAADTKAAANTKAAPQPDPMGDSPALEGKFAECEAWAQTVAALPKIRKLAGAL